MADTQTPLGLDDFTDEVSSLTRSLMRDYRVQDRDQVFCYDVTVLQWETMDAIGRLGEATMNALSGAMSLANSTMTRVVDQLVEKRLVERQTDPEDRRVVRVTLTQTGEEKLALVRHCFRESQKKVLSHVRPEDRETILWSLKQLKAARERWRSSCCPR